MDLDDKRTADVGEILSYASIAEDDRYKIATELLVAKDECWSPFYENGIGWSAVLDATSLREMDSKKRAASVARLNPLISMGILRRVIADCSAVYGDHPRAEILRLLLQCHVPTCRMLLQI